MDICDSFLISPTLKSLDELNEWVTFSIKHYRPSSSEDNYFTDTTLDGTFIISEKSLKWLNTSTEVQKLIAVVFEFLNEVYLVACKKLDLLMMARRKADARFTERMKEAHKKYFKVKVIKYLASARVTRAMDD